MNKYKKLQKIRLRKFELNHCVLLVGLDNNQND